MPAMHAFQPSTAPKFHKIDWFRHLLLPMRDISRKHPLPKGFPIWAKTC